MRIPVVLSIALICLAAGAYAAEETPLVEVKLTEKALTIDGVLDEPAWKDAAAFAIDGYCDQTRRDKGTKPKDATQAFAVSDKDHLYIGFRSDESHADGPWVFDSEKYKRRANSHVMGGDYVAVAIDMGRFGFYNYTMFFVNAKGELYKCFTWPHRYDLVLRNVALPAATAAAKIDKAAKRWSVELKIPLKDLLRHPADGMPRIIGLDLRRLQWGKERGKHSFKIYWTGMANVTSNRIKPQYDHMATWKPLFKTYPAYNGYAVGRGWVQLVFPESFGHVRLQAGTLDNKLVAGEGKRLAGLIGTRTSIWYSYKKTVAEVTRLLDRPRMEYWADLRPDHPTGRPAVIVTKPIRKPGVTPRFIAKPTVERVGELTRVSFKVSIPTDVTVAVANAKGKVVRHLACGVLGPNPPKPFEKNKLAQTVAWDHTDDFGKPVPPGDYTVAVSLGLKPTFHYAIPIDKKNWWYQDPTPTAKGLDIDNMPNPKIGGSLGHFSRGAMNYLAVDRDRDEVYVQTRYVYDGATGKKLRELKPQGIRVPDISKAPKTGELFVGRRDGRIYLTGPNEVWRFDRAGVPAPFPAVGRHFIPELWGAHSNPHRGVCVGLDGDIYKMHHYIPHTAFHNQITRIGPDGRIKDYGFIEIRALAAGVRVDREGNVYVGCTIQPRDALPPKELAAKLPERPRTLFKRVYGSIVKFGPKGGIIKGDPNGTLGCPGAKGLTPFVAQGAKWVHPGFSPMLSRVSDKRGGPACSCRNGRFDLDEFGRLFIPDAVAGRIEITDSNANTILFFGRRGTPDALSSVEFGWPTQVAASDAACYVADYLRYKVTRMKLTYDTRAAAKIAVPEVAVDHAQTLRDCVTAVKDRKHQQKYRAILKETAAFLAEADGAKLSDAQKKALADLLARFRPMVAKLEKWDPGQYTLAKVRELRAAAARRAERKKLPEQEWPTRVLFSQGFEGPPTKAYDWQGTIVTDNVPKGSKRALLGATGNKWFAQRIRVGMYFDYPRATTHNWVRFKYFINKPVPIGVFVFDLTLRNNWETKIGVPVVGKWTEVTLDLAGFREKGGGRRKIRPGDAMDDVFVHAGKPGDKKLRLLVDDVVVFGRD
jgi:hypothetical protein